MNLEEELRTLETQSVIIQPNNIENNMNTINNQAVSLDTMNTINNQTMNTIGTSTVVETPVVNQPAMVNTNQAAQQTSQFSYANLEFDINKPLYERNPLDRLVGDKGKTFRIHLLPNISPSNVHVHWDASKGHNIVCLKDVYGTQSEPCCNTHGQAKSRIVIPIIVYPTVEGNPNALIPGQKAELKALVLGYKQFQELQNQANLAGVVLTEGDIFATVDNPTYKSFNFTVRQDSLISQVPNIAELNLKWKEVGTPENICKASAKVITREEYQRDYSSYDYKEHTTDQSQQAPTSIQIPTTFPMNQGYNPYNMGGVNPGQPFYGAQGQQNFNNINTMNPWQ